MHRMFLAFVVFANAVSAQEWAERVGDKRLSQMSLRLYLVGQTVTFYDDGQSQYFEDGAYTYTYAGSERVAHGQYELHEQGKVCVSFANGFARCDLFVKAMDRIVLLTEKGERFPVRPK